MCAAPPISEPFTAVVSLRAEVTRRQQAGEAVGLGLAYFLEKSGQGPLEGVRLTVDASGTVELVTAAASLGQGVETSLAQICADELGSQTQTVKGRTRIRTGEHHHPLVIEPDEAIADPRWGFSP